MGLIRGIFNFVRNLFRNEPSRHFRKYKLVKSSIGNILEVNVGEYVSDSGYNDYSTRFELKKGKISKECICHMKKDEDTNMTNTLRLTPLTNSAYIIVIRDSLTNKGYKSIWKIILRKQQKGRSQRIIRI
jgi:hypothetical protein